MNTCCILLLARPSKAMAAPRGAWKHSPPPIRMQMEKSVILANFRTFAPPFIFPLDAPPPILFFLVPPLFKSSVGQNAKVETSLEKFHQQVHCRMRIIFVITRYLWPLESKFEWCKCVNVERLGSFGWKWSFWSKNKQKINKKMFLACIEAFTLFSLSIRVENNFLIEVCGD